MVQGLSRRSFLASGGALALGAAAGTALAQDGAQPIVTTVDFDNPAVGSVPSFMVPPAPIDPASIVETKEYDVVIVGAGCAGLGAAMGVLETGVSACVVQKQAMGVSQGNGGSGVDLAASDPAAVQKVIDIHIAANHYRPMRPLVQTWADNSGAAWQALIDFTADLEYPVVRKRDVVRTYGDGKEVRTFVAGPQGTNFAGAASLYFDAVNEKVCEVFYENPAVQLVQNESGAVTGVICESAEGYRQFNARLGVILCAGDYENDNEMVSYFLPDMANCPCKQSGKTGDGIKMGLWAGGVIEPVGHSKMSHDFGSGPMANEPFLAVDTNGARFCCEGVHLSLMQNFFRFSNPSGVWFQIFDADFEGQVASWGGEVTTADDLKPFNPEDESYKGRGHVFCADTLEELAAKLGISDVEAFTATVARYNELAAAGSDVDFGKEPSLLFPVATAPFYGIARTTGITAILSGLLTDAQQRVIDADGNPIPGLYAAGNNAGGFYGAIDYPFTGEYIDAISIGRSVAGGYAAVLDAAARA